MKGKSSTSKSHAKTARGFDEEFVFILAFVLKIDRNLQRKCLREEGLEKRNMLSKKTLQAGRFKWIRTYSCISSP
jgi:hypothetical protein